MKTLYLDCGMGAAGDMLAAALIELLPDGDAFVREVNALGIPGIHVEREASVKCGITGTHVSVTVNGVEEESIDHHSHSHEHGQEGQVCGCHGHTHEGHEHGHGQEGHSHDGHMCEGHVQEHEHGHGEHVQEHEHGHGEHAQEHEHSHGEHVQEHEHSHGEHVQEHEHSHESHVHEHSHEGHVHEQEYGHEHNHEGHDHHHPHTHSGLHDIEHIVRGHLPLPGKVKDDIMAVYGLIAEAESHAHGVPVTDIHFHEVGTMDAIADVAMVCMLMDRLAPDEVVASPVHVGSGQVRCAHGILPVPAPATAYILRDVPIYGGRIRGELCTPTGAALLKHFAARFDGMPVMRLQAIGYGMGKKDFEAANCVRAMLGETADRTDLVLELSCNVDDMTPEQVGFAMERLFAGGALDVYTVPVGMKKNRPGTLIRVVCRERDREEMLALIFRHTSTIGVREARMQRYVLDRKELELDTPYGVIRRKDSAGYGVKRSKYEYEDIARIARERGIGLTQAAALAEEAEKKQARK